MEAQLDSGGGGLVIPESLADAPEIRRAAGRVRVRAVRGYLLQAENGQARVRCQEWPGTPSPTRWWRSTRPFPLVNFGSPPMQKFAITFDQKNLLVRFLAVGKKILAGGPSQPAANDQCTDPSAAARLGAGGVKAGTKNRDQGNKGPKERGGSRGLQAPEPTPATTRPLGPDTSNTACPHSPPNGFPSGTHFPSAVPYGLATTTT